MNQKTVIIFNGPPGSGKDEACNYMLGVFNCVHMMFKDKLFELVLAIYNVDHEEFFELYNNRETKEEPTCLLRGESPRSAMIKVSEEIIKPNLGKDYFGLAAAENMPTHGMVVFSDGGFDEELGPVYDECDGNMYIVRLHRDGCNYDNDSRSYIESFRDAKIFDIDNNGTLDDFRWELGRLVFHIQMGEE